MGAICLVSSVPNCSRRPSVAIASSAHGSAVKFGGRAGDGVRLRLSWLAMWVSSNRRSATSSAAMAHRYRLTCGSASLPRSTGTWSSTRRAMRPRSRPMPGTWRSRSLSLDSGVLPATGAPSKYQPGRPTRLAPRTSACATTAAACSSWWSAGTSSATSARRRAVRPASRPRPRLPPSPSVARCLSVSRPAGSCAQRVGIVTWSPDTRRPSRRGFPGLHTPGRER